jgi:hypothetical protein
MASRLDDIYLDSPVIKQWCITKWYITKWYITKWYIIGKQWQMENLNGGFGKANNV